MTKLVLVTGSSRGIGAAIAKKYAKRPDTTVIVNYRSDASGADETCREIENGGGVCLSCEADVATAVGAQALSSFVESHFPGQPLSSLINNAGEIIRPSGWLDASDAIIVRTVEVNLLSVLWMVRAFVPRMVQAGRGHVVTLGTTYSINGAAAVLAYTAAKAGVGTLTRALAAEVGPSGVRVNNVSPGNIDTAMTRSAGEDVLAWTLDTTPLGRLGEPDEIADAVLYLEDAAFVTGHTLVVDGGQILRM